MGNLAGGCLSCIMSNMPSGADDASGDSAGGGAPRPASDASLEGDGPPTREEVEAGCPASYPVCAASDACNAELTSFLASASDDPPDLTDKSDELKNVVVCAMVNDMRNDPSGPVICLPPAEEAPATPPALQASGSAP